MSQTISDAQWWQYHEQGYLRLGKVLDDGALKGLQQRIDEIMLGKVSYEKMYMQLDAGGAYENLNFQEAGFKGPRLDYRKIQDLERDPLFLDFMQRPLFREICDYHYGAHASISVFRAMFMNKPARKGTMLPWHQDGGDGWGLDRDPLATLWTALDPATIANGCVQIIPGSHKLGLLSKRGHTLSPEHVEQYCPESKIEYLELKPGEAVLLHNWLVHRSDVNKTDIPRRAFSVCYVDARTRGTKNGEAFPVVFGENALVAKEVQHA
jgi:phytanoyl-CoA hydroxylase